MNDLISATCRQTESRLAISTSSIIIIIIIIIQDGFIHIAASGWISVNTEEKKNKHYIQKVKNQ